MEFSFGIGNSEIVECCPTFGVNIDGSFKLFNRFIFLFVLCVCVSKVYVAFKILRIRIGGFFETVYSLWKLFFITINLT